LQVSPSTSFPSEFAKLIRATNETCAVNAIFKMTAWFVQNDGDLLWMTSQTVGEPSSSFWGIVDVVASVSSVIALILTLFILYQTSKLRNRYLFLIRTPHLVTQLEEHRFNISEYLGALSVYQQELRIELTTCRANLKNLKPKLNCGTKSSLKTLDRNIQRVLQPDPVSSDDAWALYRELAGFIAEVQNLLEDQAWRP
jgi:predicted alpha/beta-hydrolase family hydrolase